MAARCGTPAAPISSEVSTAPTSAGLAGWAMVGGSMRARCSALARNRVMRRAGGSANTSLSMARAIA